MIFFGSAFHKATDAFVDKLECLHQPMELVPSGFLLHLLELALSKYFRALRMATTTVNMTLRDISTPAACATYLSLVLKIFVSTLDTQEKLNEAMARYQLLDYPSRLGNPAKTLLPGIKQQSVRMQRRLCAESTLLDKSRHRIQGPHVSSLVSTVTPAGFTTTTSPIGPSLTRLIPQPVSHIDSASPRWMLWARSKAARPAYDSPKRVVAQPLRSKECNRLFRQAS